ncbi:FtsB family cell division protein [Ornithinimicrobium pratense]|uniref:Septum formation initiator family protein n=1 Tax=Ornithinimicrobium pratense TaxID=2593973 RepID=A0A5J6V361_9MICO|nr:septum formation initiator family protein [Ornithinimicrobium pratense]QFG67754.1 septum formation initiator family protein [Ornithinimicrobium pratense]
MSTRPPRRPTARPGQPMPTRAAASRPVGVSGRTPVHVRRLITLAVLLVLMGVVVTPTLSGYLQQRADITATEQQIEAEKKEIAALEAELQTWSDPAHVEQQARERLRYVKEGETVFAVIDDTGTDYSEALPGMAPVSEETIEQSPWYGQVWESVRIANEGLPETTTP